MVNRTDTISMPDVADVLSRPLSKPDGRVGTIAEVAGDDTVLIVVVERDCPTSQGALRALADTDGRVAVVSQGRIEATQSLLAACGMGHGGDALAGAVAVLVDTAPYDVSRRLGAATVPSFLLVDDGVVVAHQEGWDAAVVGQLVARAGGTLRSDGGLPGVKPGCQSRHTFDAELQHELEREDAALAGDPAGRIEDLWELGWHDGLPVVPPTPGRVQAMLDGRNPETSLGLLGPAQGEVTYERLAACAVMAGCTPAYWPVVEAGARAVIDPAFNAHGVINTTHFASPWLIVNGPIRNRLGMNAGSNVLGPGNRANATIGRAVRLMMQLTGGGNPGGLDQSTLGGQHKITACIPEHEEASPWEPWHVTCGYDPDISTVLAIVGEGPAGFHDHTSNTPEDLGLTVAKAAGNALVPAGSPAFHSAGSETLILLCPEHATTFHQGGWSKQRLREYIVEHGGGKHADPEELVIIVTGGRVGRFSAVAGPWAGHGLGSTPVLRIIQDI